MKKILKRENLPWLLAALFVILIILLFLQFNRMGDLKYEIKRQELLNKQNTQALTDSLRVVSDKLDSAEYNKTAYVAKVDDLEDLNAELSNKIDAMKGEVMAYIASKVNATIPPADVDNVLKTYPDGVTYGLEFNREFADSGLTYSLSGESRFKLINNKLFAGETRFGETRFDIGLDYGMKELDDRIEVFAKPMSPYVSFSELDGVMIIPKKPNEMITPAPKPPRFGLSVQAGIYYLPFTNKIGPGVGVGLHYSLTRRSLRDIRKSLRNK